MTMTVAFIPLLGSVLILFLVGWAIVAVARSRNRGIFFGIALCLGLMFALASALLVTRHAVHQTPQLIATSPENVMTTSQDGVNINLPGLSVQTRNGQTVVNVPGMQVATPAKRSKSRGNGDLLPASQSSGELQRLLGDDADPTKNAERIKQAREKMDRLQAQAVELNHRILEAQRTIGTRKAEAVAGNGEAAAAVTAAERTVQEAQAEAAAIREQFERALQDMPARPELASNAKIYPTRISAALALAKGALRHQLPKLDCPLRVVRISGDDSVVVSEMVRRLPLESEDISGWGQPEVTSTSDGIAQTTAPPAGELRMHVWVHVAPGMSVDQGGRVDFMLRSTDSSMSSSALYSEAALAATSSQPATPPAAPSPYRTRIAAALGLTKNLLRGRLATAEDPPQVVSISGDDAVVVSEMVRRLPLETAGIPGWGKPKVIPASEGSGQPVPSTGELRVHVSVTVPPGGDVDQGGRVDVTMRSSDGELSSSAEYSDKAAAPPPAAPPAAVAATTDRTAPGAVVGTPWTPSEQHPFQPNIYPTRISAALGIAKGLLGDYLPKLFADTPLRLVTISGDDPAVVSEMVRRLPKEALGIPGWGCANVVLVPQGQQQQPIQNGELRFQVSVHVNPGMTADQGGRVELTMRSSGAEATYSAEYVEAPWSEDFQKWVRQHPGHNWILATSDQLCTSESQAIEQTREVAVRELAKRVDAYVSQSRWTRRAYGPELLRSAIARELNEGGIRVQQFTQQFQRPYGDLWRCAWLVDASPEVLQRIAAKYCQAESLVRQTWARTLLSGLGLLLLIIGVYLLLNAATRGYYAWTIRVMLLAVAAVGLWFVLAC